jgi:hypothetical protein
MRVFKVKIEDHQNFEPEGPRFTVHITETTKSSPYAGESIITLNSDYTSNLSPVPGDKTQELEVHAASCRRAMHLLLMLRGLAPYTVGVGNGLSRVKVLEQEAHCLFKLKVTVERD